MSRTNPLDRVLGRVVAIERVLDPNLYCTRDGQETELPEALRSLTTISPPQEIISAYCQMAGIEEGDIIGDTKPRDLADNRHAIMYALRAHTGLSLKEIGSRLGGRDHTTVLHGANKIERALGHYRGRKELILASEAAKEEPSQEA